MHAEISQVLQMTECQDCKQKQLKISMLRSQSSQKRLGISGRIETDGVVSEYWDMESSQASNTLDNLGRFAMDNEISYQDSSINLDSQVMIINDPSGNNRAAVKATKQNSVLSQILNNSGSREKKEGVSNDLLDEGEDFNLEPGISAAKGPYDLLSKK